MFEGGFGEIKGFAEGLKVRQESKASPCYLVVLGRR